MQEPKRYKWEFLCLNCGAVYLYYDYPPYSTCFNCGSNDREIRKLGTIE